MCVCVSARDEGMCVPVWQLRLGKKGKVVRGRRKFEDDMLGIYSSAAGFYININLPQVCASEQFVVCFSLRHI